MGFFLLPARYLTNITLRNTSVGTECVTLHTLFLRIKIVGTSPSHGIVMRSALHCRGSACISAMNRLPTMRRTDDDLQEYDTRMHPLGWWVLLLTYFFTVSLIHDWVWAMQAQFFFWKMVCAQTHHLMDEDRLQEIVCWYTNSLRNSLCCGMTTKLVVMSSKIIQIKWDAYLYVWGQLRSTHRFSVSNLETY